VHQHHCCHPQARLVGHDAAAEGSVLSCEGAGMQQDGNCMKNILQLDSHTMQQDMSDCGISCAAGGGGAGERTSQQQCCGLGTCIPSSKIRA
jgi:hypothetical protein